MAAEEHLSDQFEIVHPHRLVRIGERTYPAARTTSDEDHPNEKQIGFKAAWIPMENGQLLRVSHFDDEPGKFYMHAPIKADAAKEGSASMEPHHTLQDPYGNPRPFLRAHGAELATKMIDAESTRSLKPEEQADAKAQLKRFRNG